MSSKNRCLLLSILWSVMAILWYLNFKIYNVEAGCINLVFIIVSESAALTYLILYAWMKFKE